MPEQAVLVTAGRQPMDSTQFEVRRSGTSSSALCLTAQSLLDRAENFLTRKWPVYPLADAHAVR